MNVAIVGAGKGGTSIINCFSNNGEIKITQVISRDMDAPGISLAKKLGIRCSQSIDDILTHELDIIIEATGNADVTRALYEKYGDVCNIIDSKGALLIMTLVRKDIQNMEALNNQINAIKNASSSIQEHIKDISTAIDSTNEINKRLVDFTETSSTYLDESDKIIRYVNSIAKQTKILGINANIEAAKAGEHGRGFGVVANEVQKLANSSETYAREINNILAKLAGEIKNVKIQVDSLNKLTIRQVQSSSNVNSAVEQLAAETD